MGDEETPSLMEKLCNEDGVKVTGKEILVRLVFVARASPSC